MTRAAAARTTRRATRPVGTTDPGPTVVGRHSHRGCAALAAAAVLGAGALAGCSGSSTPSANALPSPTQRADDRSVALAQAALVRVRHSTALLRSMSFRAVITTRTPGRTVTRRIVGRSEADRATYVVSGTGVRRIVQIGHVVYGRGADGTWHQRRTTDPVALASLRQTLALARAGTVPGPGRLTAVLTPEAVAGLGLLSGVRATGPVTVRLTLDGGARARTLSAAFAVPVGGRNVRVTFHDVYSRFNEGPPIRAPRG